MIVSFNVVGCRSGLNSMKESNDKVRTTCHVLGATVTSGKLRVGLKVYQGKHQLRLVLQCVILRPFHVQQKLYNVGCSKADAVSIGGLSM